MTIAIETRGLTKVYGHQRALDSLDLVVEEGSVFGFLGPNGAGKTTTLRILTGLGSATSGTVRVLGHDVTAGSDARAEIGFLPDVPGFYDWMTADEFLRFAGSLFGLGRRVLDKRIGVLLGLAGLADVTTRIGGYSRGMRQRLGVAQALINAPRLLMLDEPTSALDPMGRRAVLDMIASLRGRTTVFFSTHILSDVERVCDTVAVLDKGRLRALAPIEEIKARYRGDRIVVEVEEGSGRLVEALSAQPWAGAVKESPNGVVEVTFLDEVEAKRGIPAVVASLGLPLRRMEPAEVGLEEAFVRLVEGGDR